jgi:hypothetical protein
MLSTCIHTLVNVSVHALQAASSMHGVLYNCMKLRALAVYTTLRAVLLQLHNSTV